MSIKHIVALLAGVAATLLHPPAGRADTVASLLGNFTVNQFCELKVARTSLDVHYAVVYGQLPALRELHNADANGDGVTSQAERDAYVGTLALDFAGALEVLVDGVRLPLHATHWSSSLPTEQGGFSLRVDVDFEAPLPAGSAAGTHTLRFSNQNFADRLGWHEIVVNPTAGVAVFDTDAYDTSATGALAEALQALPDTGPLDERIAHLRFDAAGPPSGAVLVGPRPPTAAASGGVAGTESRWLTRRTRELIDGLSGPHLRPRVVLWALLAALFLGAVHALSPGHGKTLVGAYLIGSRGTPRHALFLGLTVTVTHTLGVFILGFATLYASRFIVPERLFPILSLISALLVLGLGMLLLVQRARTAGRVRTEFSAMPASPAESTPRHRLLLVRAYGYADGHGEGHFHSHGGPMHSHFPLRAAGERVTWKSLATLGISGGLVPCPSAMVLLLAAIALNKTAYGMVLVVVFSAGLALTLTAVGLAFLYARNHFSKRAATARWTQVLPTLSAALIILVGIALFFAALKSLI